MPRTFLGRDSVQATKKDVGAKPKRVDMRDLFVNNAKLWSGNLRLVLVGNLRHLTQQREGHLELDPGNWSITLGKVWVGQVRLNSVKVKS